MHNRRTLFLSACAGLALFGVVLAIVGTLFGFPDVRARMQMTELRQGWMSSCLLAGVWLATVVAGPVIDRHGNRFVLAISAALVAAGLVLFAMANSFGPALAAGALLGFGGGGLNTSTNALVSDIYHDDRGAMLTLLGMCFGIGALGMPLVAAALTHSPKTPLIVGAAILSAAVAILYLVLPFPAGREAHNFSWRESARVVVYPGVLLFSFVLFCESWNENAMITFTSRWFEHARLAQGAQHAARGATLVLAAFQGSMMGGRLLAARVLRNASKIAVVRGSAAVAVVGTLVMLLGHSAALELAGVVVTGLALAAIYPMVLAEAGDRYDRFAGSVFGVLFAIALVGGIVSPSAVGIISASSGLRYMPLVPCAGAVGIVVLLGFAKRAGKPTARN